MNSKVSCLCTGVTNKVKWMAIFPHQDFLYHCLIIHVSIDILNCVLRK